MPRQPKSETQLELERLGAHVMALETLLGAFLDIMQASGALRPEIARLAFDRAVALMEITAGKISGPVADVHATRILDYLRKMRAAHLRE